MTYDLAVIGAGPGGCAAAFSAARSGLKVALFDRVAFPRDKVCGDCLNPSVIPLLEEFRLSENLPKIPHTLVEAVDFLSPGKKVRSFDVSRSIPREVVLRRRDLDYFLLQKTLEAGVDFFPNEPVEEVRGGWRIRGRSGEWKSRLVVLADGRNSATARGLGLIRPGTRERVGMQARFPLPDGAKGRVRMFFLPSGYGGMADAGDGTVNVSVVSRPESASTLQREVCDFFHLEQTRWLTISPISRAPARFPAKDGLFLVGDVARVVEPFTGEGIYYAVRTGQLAGEACARELRQPGTGTERYCKIHPSVYAGRLWINRLSRVAGKHSKMMAALLPHLPERILGALTRKVVGSASSGLAASLPSPRAGIPGE